MPSMKLDEYLAAEDVSIATFAGLIGVSVQAVHRYLSGERIPRPDLMERIEATTGGRVQANDLYAARRAFVPRAAA